MNNKQFYQNVTNQILALLREHLASWEKPWVSVGAGGGLASNALTKTAYKGINQIILCLSKHLNDYESNFWLTFNQARILRAQVKSGSKAVQIMHFSKIHLDEEGRIIKDVNGIDPSLFITIPKFRHFNVFNVDQITGLPSELYSNQKFLEFTSFEKDTQAEQLISQTRAKVEIKASDSAYYNPISDVITLPLREQFTEKEPFYATALHELGHWTGHPTRLNRDLCGKFGSEKYAFEELIAELTSAFCCAHLGFTKTITSNASYINSWIIMLEENSGAIVSASAKAQSATDYILNLNNTLK